MIRSRGTLYFSTASLCEIRRNCKLVTNFHKYLCSYNPVFHFVQHVITLHNSCVGQGITVCP